MVKRQKQKIWELVGKNTAVIASIAGLVGISIIAFVLLPMPSIQKDTEVEEDIRLIADTKYNHYTNGETVNIRGLVTDSDRIPLSKYDHAITIQIFFDDTLKEVAQITPLQNGTFSHSVETSWMSWENGQYTLKAFYDGNMAIESFNLKPSNPSKVTPTQIGKFEEMSCETLVEENSSGITIESKDVRDFVRQKINHCQSMQEQSVWYGQCSTTLLIANHNFKHLTDNVEWTLQHALDRCVNKGNLELADLPVSNQHVFCETADKHKICGELPVYSQPFKEVISWEELYQKVIENEKNFYNGVDCTVLFDTYDGKMHTVGWEVKKDVIFDRFDECKENEN